MKKIIFLILAIIVGIVVYFVFFYKTVEAPKIDDAQDISLPKEITVTDSKKQIIRDGYEIDFKFPYTGKEKIDSAVAVVVDELITSFEEDAKNFLLTPLPDQRNYTLIGDYQANLGSEYDTFVFLVSIDFGGAHPNHFYKTITFDKSENVLSLQDVLNKEIGKTDVLEKISELSRQKISERLKENTNQQMLEDGTMPDWNNFRNFYVVENELVLLFEPYAVAPYAYSTQEARINFDEIF